MQVLLSLWLYMYFLCFALSAAFFANYVVRQIQSLHTHMHMHTHMPYTNFPSLIRYLQTNFWQLVHRTELLPTAFVHTLQSHLPYFYSITISTDPQCSQTFSLKALLVLFAVLTIICAMTAFVNHSTPGFLRAYLVTSVDAIKCFFLF